jgi:hypothetical protein
MNKQNKFKYKITYFELLVGKKSFQNLLNIRFIYPKNK